jgi:cell division protein FtsL
MESFEYAIKKDVRNNPIVREVDAARHREQWHWTGAGAVVVVVLLFLAWQRSTLLDLDYQIEELKSAHRAEEAIGRELRLKIETLRAPQRIERMAIKDLHLVYPTLEEAFIIERVVSTAPPANSVVARR